jgi:hypothetical protein
MTPGETALTRIPRDAYSMASDRVAAARPPLVSAVSTEGTLESATSCQSKEPREVDADDRVIVVCRVVDERFGEIEPRIVDQRVDPTERLQGGDGDSFGGPRIREVPATVCTAGSSMAVIVRAAATTARSSCL